MLTLPKELVLPENWSREKRPVVGSFTVEPVPLRFGTRLCAPLNIGAVASLLAAKKLIATHPHLCCVQDGQVISCEDIQPIIKLFLETASTCVRQQFPEYIRTWRQTRDYYFTRERVDFPGPLEDICLAAARDLDNSNRLMQWFRLAYSAVVELDFGYVGDYLNYTLLNLLAV